MKRVIPILLAVLMLTGIMPVSVFAAEGDTYISNIEGTLLPIVQQSSDPGEDDGNGGKDPEDPETSPAPGADLDEDPDEEPAETSEENEEI